MNKTGTTDTVHVDLEEILENRQDQPFSSTSTPAQSSTEYTTTDPGVDAGEQNENETITEEHVHVKENGSNLNAPETSQGHVKQNGSDLNTPETNSGSVKKNASTEAQPTLKNLAPEIVPRLLETRAGHKKKQDRPVLWFKHNSTPGMSFAITYRYIYILLMGCMRVV